MSQTNQKGTLEIPVHPVDKFINSAVEFIESYLKTELIWSEEQLEWVVIKFDTNMDHIYPVGELDRCLPDGIDQIYCTDNPEEEVIDYNFQNYDDFYKSLNSGHISNLKLYFYRYNQYSSEEFTEFMESPFDINDYHFHQNKILTKKII